MKKPKIGWVEIIGLATAGAAVIFFVSFMALFFWRYATNTRTAERLAGELQERHPQLTFKATASLEAGGLIFRVDGVTGENVKKQITEWLAEQKARMCFDDPMTIYFSDEGESWRDDFVNHGWRKVSP